MQEWWREARSPFASSSFSFPSSSSSASQHLSDDALPHTTAPCLCAIVLAGGCGVLLGWQSRGWCIRHPASPFSYMRRERRQRNPLWLLPAPTAAPSAAFVGEWVAACLGHRWTPGWVWAPPLLRYKACAYTADSQDARRVELARADVTRWGTRMLNRMHGAHLVNSIERHGGMQGERLLPVRGQLSGFALQWQPLDAYPVDLFSDASAPTAQVMDTSASSSSSSCSASMPLRVLPRHSFALLYDPLARLSLWCGYHITRTSAQLAQRQRRCLAVYTDRSLEKTARRIPAEVRHRGYDRGHLAPHASVATTAQAAMEATLLTNILPQHRDVNRGVWRWLEAATRAYVRIPYDYGTAMPTSEERVGRAARVRKDGVLLARLLAQQTPLATAEAARRRRRARWWGSAAGKDDDGRHLCVNVGPLFYSAKASSSARDGERGGAATSHGAAGERKPGRRQRQRRHATRCAKAMTTTARRGGVGVRQAAAQHGRLALIPDAFFLSLWDAQTHHHLHLVVPNTRETAEMQTLTRALTAFACRTQPPPTRRRRRPCASVTKPTACAAAEEREAEKAVATALAAFAVTTERLEALFADSLVEVRRRWSAGASDVSFALASPSAPPLTLRTGFRFFPVYRARWMWQTWRQRLAQQTSLKLLMHAHKDEKNDVAVCQASAPWLSSLS